MDGRRIYHARGKVLGGSSSINGMIFQRGNPLDYERWAADPGMATWAYAHCLPYFKRMETCLAGADEFRGGNGPLVLERGPADNPLFGAFFEAVQQAGYALTDDVNGYRQEGFARFDRNIHAGRRLSAARAYLHPVHRPAQPRRCAPARSRRSGSRSTARGRSASSTARWRGRRHHVDGRRGGLCGGAFNSPQVLQLSGVGNAADLRGVGVDLVHHLPAVGEQLQDHLEVYVQHACTQPVSLNPLLQVRKRRPWIGMQWLLGRGPGTTNHFEAGGFARCNDEVAYPNLMFHFLPLAVRYDGSSPPGGHGYQVHIGPMYSDARGSVRITAPDARVKPALRFNYLSTEQDRREWVEAIAVARDIFAQPAWEPFDGGEISPGPTWHDRTGARLGGRRRRDGAPPVLHVPHGDRRRFGDRPAHDDACTGSSAARGRRLGDALRHQRQHLRAGDDARREGRRPDPRQHPAAPRAGRVLPSRSRQPMGANMTVRSCWHPSVVPCSTMRAGSISAWYV